MYVYYETYKYRNGRKDGKLCSYYSVSFYTHRITVHERCYEQTLQKLITKFGSKAVSYSKRNKRAYVRETLRIATYRKAFPSHKFYSRMDCTERLQVRNDGLGLFFSRTEDSRLERVDYSELV